MRKFLNSTFLMFFVFPFTVFPLFAFAQGSRISTSALLVLPKSVATITPRDFSGAFQSAQPERVVEAGRFPVKLSPFTVDLKYKVHNFALLDDIRFAVNADFNDLVVHIPHLSVDTIVEEIINGTLVRVRYKADCYHVILENSHSLATSARGQLTKNPLSGKLESVEVPPLSPSWKARAERCEAPAGFLASLESAVNSSWSNPSFVQEMIHTEISAKLPSLISESSVWTQDVNEIQSRIELRLEDFSDKGKDRVIKLGISVTPWRECPLLAKDGQLDSPNLSHVKGGPELLFNQRLINLVGRCMHEMHLFDRIDKAQEIPGIQKLLRSSLLKGLVWPDLNRFSPSTNFIISSRTVDGFSLYGKNPTAQEIKTMPNTLFLNLYANIKSLVSYPSANAMVPYVSFLSTVRSVLALQFVGGNGRPSELLVRTYGEPKTELQYNWETNVSNPNIAVDQLKPELDALLRSTRTRIPIPPISINPTTRLEASQVFKEGLLVRLKLKLVP